MEKREYKRISEVVRKTPASYTVWHKIIDNKRKDYCQPTTAPIIIINILFDSLCQGHLLKKIQYGIRSPCFSIISSHLSLIELTKLGQTATKPDKVNILLCDINKKLMWLKVN